MMLAHAGSRQSNRHWLAPLVFFQVYLSITVLLFFFGPWPWDVEDPQTLSLFLISSQVAVLLGYMAAGRTLARLEPTASSLQKGVAHGVNFLRIAIWITWLLAIPSSLSRTGNWYPDIFQGVENAGLAYNENFERLDAGNSYVIVEYLRMLFSYFLTAVLPLTIVYWGKLSPRWKLFAAATIAFNLSLYLSTGINKGIADFVVTLPWLIALGLTCGTLRIPKLKVVGPLAFVSIFVAFLVFFGDGQQRREGSGTEYSSFFTGLSVLQASGDHFISRLLPENARIIFESLSRYVVQGYYALSLALSTDSPSTLGFGHSMFLSRNADVIFGTDFFVNSSMPGILEKEHAWPMFLLWHSIYTWLASDVGFIGTILVMGLFAYLLGLSWGMAARTGSAPWITLAFLLLVLFYYVPANNQIFQSGETCVCFFIVLFAALRQLPSIARRGTVKSI